MNWTDGQCPLRLSICPLRSAGGGVGAGAGVGVGVGVGAGVGEGFEVGGGIGAGCWIWTVSDAIVIVAARNAPVFGVAVTVMVDGPVPDPGATEIHAALGIADQLHAGLVPRVIVVVPPGAGSAPAGPETEYWHGAAPCETDAWAFATTMVP